MSVPDVLPPSPPTTNHRHRSSLPTPLEPMMSTPDDSPASFHFSSSTGIRKRVGFTPWPTTTDNISSTPTSGINILKALPPSRDCQTSGKSILKPFVDPVVLSTGLDGSNDMQPVPPETLETIAQQLANNNKGSSLDAYQILSQVIKAYDEVPEDVNTRSCLASILRSIRRDLSIQDQTQSSPIDTNLMTQALKVAVILVWSEHLSPLLTDEFRVFIIDRSINALTEHTVPKIIIIHYMHLLAMQNFRSGILSSNNRAVRLLEALQDITNHVQGKGAIAERLLIYQKLIEQAKPIMKARASPWIKETFMGLSSSVKDIRDKAISLSTRACVAFPASPTISAAAREALASTVPDRAGNNRVLSVSLTQRLEKMVAAKDEASQVPQIWALAMLLCNSIDTRLESWSLLRDWLKVIQRCFNCSDASVRSQAFPAWNRFIYISRPHEASETIVSMLAKPIIAQIERSSSNTNGKGIRPAAISSYCMLLYHAFRPAASHKQYTRMWNEYIVKIMGTQFLSKSTANADLCSRVIMSLMWKEHSASRVWNENRAHENTLLEPEELPTIDCKWIRSKTEAILQIFHLLFKHSVWGPSVQHSDQAYVARAWRHFLKAIRESASKEIKPSADTRRSVSSIIQFLHEVMLSKPPSKPVHPEGRSQLACSIAVAELGPLCFLECMELDMNLCFPVVLGELLKVTVRTLSEAQHTHTQLKPQALQRCFKLLDATLQKAYDCFDQDHSILQSLINITSKTLKLMPPDTVLPCLTLLQQSLSTIIKDQKNLAKLGSHSSSLIQQWMDLSMTVVDALVTIPAAGYEQFDGLLTATLLSCNIFTQNSLLKAWRQAGWPEDVSYGPQLLDAISFMQHQSEINIPGLVAQREPVEIETQIRRDVQIDSFKDKDQTPEPQILAQSDSHQDEVNQTATKTPIVETDIIVLNKSSDLAAQDNAEVQSRIRHNNSQIDFVPVDSSPANYDEAESQFLTDRQKEVREKQRTEQVVTFPDLRSSPRSRTTRQSRASSADCEMARKVAAMEDLPSTPTIMKQVDAMDEDELPSPTPKCRHKILQLSDVEIPSSPPSVIRHRKASSGAEDVPSSPPKPHNDGEIDMVNLDDQDLAPEECGTEMDATMDDISEAHESNIALEAVEPVNPDDLTLNTDVTTQPSHTDSNLGSAVLETVPDVNNLPLESQGPIRMASLDAGYHEDVESDEVDELSASQLSQSLDWHIAEEARQSFIVEEPPSKSQTVQKRKKRATNGYADQDRKKRRRRIVTKIDANMSSMSSEGSNVTSEDLDMEDSIVVNTTPIRTSSQHAQTPRDQGDCLPLHIKSPVQIGSEYATVGPAPIDTEAQRASTEVLDESVYQSILTKSAHLRSPEAGDGLQDGDADHSQHITSSENFSSVASAAAQSSSTHETDVMTALKTALEGLKKAREDQQASIDLKAIDELCFNIRYQAQELMQGRKHA